MEEEEEEEEEEGNSVICSWVEERVMDCVGSGPGH